MAKYRLLIRSLHGKKNQEKTFPEQIVAVFNGTLIDVDQYCLEHSMLDILVKYEPQYDTILLQQVKGGKYYDMHNIYSLALEERDILKKCLFHAKVSGGQILIDPSLDFFSSFFVDLKIQFGQPKTEDFLMFLMNEYKNHRFNIGFSATMIHNLFAYYQLKVKNDSSKYMREEELVEMNLLWEEITSSLRNYRKLRDYLILCARYQKRYEYHASKNNAVYERYVPTEPQYREGSKTASSGCLEYNRKYDEHLTEEEYQAMFGDGPTDENRGDYHR